MENGVLTVQAGTRSRFDVILMDMQMPVMDGLTCGQAVTAASLPAGIAQAVVE